MTTTSGKLRGKSAIVTGAASGIGREIAFTFAREGAKVAIADLDKVAADAAAAEIRAAGDEAIGVAMDVCSEEAVAAGVAATVAAFGGVDILVSNAGTQIVYPLQDVAEATLFFAAFPNNALTGQSLVVSHGWFME